jgi:hypothetical protein
MTLVYRVLLAFFAFSTGKSFPCFAFLRVFLGVLALWRFQPAFDAMALRGNGIHLAF